MRQTDFRYRVGVEPNHKEQPVFERTTFRDYPLAKGLHHFFEAQVARTPESVSVSCNGENHSYRQLNERANQLAHYLRRKGVARGCLVAVVMERSFELVVALYGILKAGAAYVPIDPEYPVERIEFMISDVRPAGVIIQDRFRNRIPSAAVEVLAIDTEWQKFEDFPVDNPEDITNPDDLSYVIFTSGSTGQPKGAMISHKAIANRLFWMQELFQLGEADRVLQKTPYTFDVSVWEFFWPLQVGARLVVAKPGGHKDSTYLIDLATTTNVTTIHFVPSMLQLFLENPRVGECSSHLKRVICSGEALPKALQERFFQKLDSDLYNLYGPTEAAIDVTFWKCEPTSDLPFVPIGKPAPNTQIYVVDDELKPVETGDVGEILIGGVQVGEGYLRRPELTSERFLADHFTTVPGGRLYRTGDLGRYLRDGNIQFLGRTDFQVKIRGYRVELGEIEAALEKIPGVQQAVVLAVDHNDGSKSLVAYLKVAGQKALRGSNLETLLSKTLPEYMVPSTFVCLDLFPLNSSGKVDRAALPKPSASRPDLDVKYTPPRTALERYLADLWGSVLNVHPIGIHDRFFELGGTSLQGARFINELQRALDQSIYMASLFAAPTVAEYAAFLLQQYAEPVAKRFDVAVPGVSTSQKHKTGISDADIEKFRHCIPGAYSGQSKSEKNSSAVFILAPPRSGTTLLRIMLAGHPQLFAASELQLLGFGSLKERSQAYAGKYSMWLDGTIRTLMEIKGCGPEEAKKLMADAESENMPIMSFYRQLQEWIKPRILVDKSPSYSLDVNSLAQAEGGFEDALYIHLIRDPRAMMKSFVNRRMDQAMYLKEHSFSPEKVAELIWTISNQNAKQFLDTIPQSRWSRIKFEDLVTHPRREMERLCQLLRIPFDGRMLTPYDDLEHKMVDGVYDVSAPMGDPHFFEHGQINPAAAVSWKTDANNVVLGSPTLELARILGYEIGDGSSDIAPESRESATTSRNQRLVRQRVRRRSSRDIE